MYNISDLIVIKKDGTKEPFDVQKTVKAINKSAERVMITFTDEEIKDFTDKVKEKALEVAEKNQSNEIAVADMHKIVESSLDGLNSEVAKSYRDYRNYKINFVRMMDEVYKSAQKIMYLGDRDNANTDSTLVSTRRSLTYNALNKELYKKFFLTTDELQDIKDGYYYIHDMSARRDTMNCCLCDIKAILDGGFEMANQWYTEPKSLDTAFDVIGDVVLSAASQQYGGFTVPQIDQVLVKYAKMSYDKYYKESYDKEMKSVEFIDNLVKDKEEAKKIKEKATKRAEKISRETALEKIRRDYDQGFQGWEYKFNTVASSRGDYPFITMTFGLGTSELERMSNIEMCKVRADGQGKPGFKRLVLFPKLVFLEDKRIHGKGKIARDVYDAAIDCSRKSMYPDWLSLEPGSYVGDMYQKYGKVVSPMGCRAFLSPWFERGGMNPADDKDQPIFIGRFNLGAISLNLPMILRKAQLENKDFFDLLDYYMQKIRKIHKRTYDYLGEMRASVNPLMYCQGGFYGGHLNPNDKIRPILKSCTLSFGYTALNETQRLYNGKSIYEDGEFALAIMKRINDNINKWKQEDGLLWAIYGTPAESLCGTQVKQFRAKYGIIPGVSDKEYFSNSFHCHVSEDITPTEKQDAEKRFWNLSNGGKIQYVRYTSDKNKEAIEALIDRAMNMGFYEGVNMDKDYCEECGYQAVDFPDHKCPKCGSTNIVEVNRVCGYLGYTKIHGKSRMNDAKMAEVADRKSM